jgi:hypothetical protein
MSAEDSFFLCPTCFEASDARIECHGHTMVRCECGRPGDERRKPLVTAGGRLETRAPRWFWDAVRPLVIARHSR